MIRKMCHMDADYGYDLEISGNQRCLEIRRNFSWGQCIQASLGCICACLIGVGVCLLARWPLDFCLIWCVLMIVAYSLETKWKTRSTRIDMSDVIRLGRRRYKRSSVENVESACVSTAYWVSRNCLSGTRLKAVHTQGTHTSYVAFDYGAKKILVASGLTANQSRAIALEIKAWVNNEPPVHPL